MATIVLVEAHHRVAGALAGALAGHGHAVLRAEGAAEARALLRRVRPGLVLLALALPAPGGLALCAEIRAGDDVPIILSGAPPRAPERALGLQAGADDVVPAPCDPDELAARVEAVLRRAGRR